MSYKKNKNKTKKKQIIMSTLPMTHLIIPQGNANHFKMHIRLLSSKTTYISKCAKKKNTDKKHTIPSLSKQRGGDME